MAPTASGNDLCCWYWCVCVVRCKNTADLLGSRCVTAQCVGEVKLLTVNENHSPFSG